MAAPPALGDAKSSSTAGISLLLVVTTAAAALVLGLFAKQLVADPLRRFPGPFFARISNIWRLQDALRHRTDITQRSLHRKYGSAVRIGPNCISLSDPALIAQLYSTRQPYLKSDFYSAADTIAQGRRIQTQFTTRDEAWHDYLIRPIKTAYSLTNILKFEPLVNQTLDHFVSLLDKDYAGGQQQRVCPLGDLLMYAAWDVAGEITFSKRLGVLDGDTDMRTLLRTNEKVIHYLGIIGQMPWLDGLIRNSYFSLGPPGFKIAADFAAVELKARVEAGTMREKGAAESDFIDLFINAEMDKDQGGEGTQLTRRQISWLIINVVAGSDTTAATLKAAVYYVLRNLKIKTRLVQELNTAISQGRDVSDWKTCQSLSYLDAIIKESLRLAPAVGMLLERVVPAEGLLLKDGRHIPAGTLVGINPRVVNHNRETYGHDAASFNPERWLQAAGETETDYQARINRMKAADLTFGAGRRSCIGRNVALVEIYKFVSRLFVEFDIELADPQKEWTVRNGWFVREDGIDVLLKRRLK